MGDEGVVDIPIRIFQMRWIRIILPMIFAAYAAAWSVVGWIETSALHQPSSATGEYRYPHQIKGKVRYFTFLQDRIHAIAKPAMLGSWVVGSLTICAGILIDRRIKQKAIRHALERDGDDAV